MDYSQLIIGLIVGFIIGLALLRVLDRRHQKVIKKLVESRRKIERQRTQAVNDLFALRAEIEEGTYQAPVEPVPAMAAAPDPRVVAARAPGSRTRSSRWWPRWPTSAV